MLGVAPPDEESTVATEAPAVLARDIAGMVVEGATRTEMAGAAVVAVVEATTTGTARRGRSPRWLGTQSAARPNEKYHDDY